MIDITPKTSSGQRLPRWLTIPFVLSFILFLWAASYYIVARAVERKVPQISSPTPGDLATLLFGASSLALILFSFVLALAAVFGWETLKNNVRRELEAASNTRVETLEQELYGRVLSVIGLMIGTLHSEPQERYQDPDNQDYLFEAVYYCQKGYDILKKVEGYGKYMALNNLVYYSCLHGERAKGDYLLKQAQTLKEVGQEFNSPDYLLSYCRAVLEFGSDPIEIQGAQSIADALLSDNKALTPRQTKEATMYVTSLADRLSEIRGASNP